MKLAVVVPSRGMMFSQTAEELLRELNGIDYRLFFSIGRKLPDCFNTPIKEALKDPKVTHVLICEDDMVLPQGILNEMLKQNYPVVALDYPFKEDGDATSLRAPDGMAIYTGTGFILINRLVLDKMPYPYFYTDTAWDAMITAEDELIFFPRDVSKIKTYGLHDVHFGLTMYSIDIPILVMPRTAGQRKLKRMGKANSNEGHHDIYIINKVWENNTTKNADPDVVAQYVKRINRIKTVRILDKKPDNIYYEDGQARAYQEHVII